MFRGVSARKKGAPDGSGGACSRSQGAAAALAGRPDVADIAAAVDLPARTVRHLIRRLRQAPAAETLAPAYEHCGWQRSWPNQELYHDAVELRRQHAAWGAGLIRVILQEHWPQQPLPSTRTLQRWFARAGLGPAPKGRQPHSHQRARRPHEVWQMDAVEQLHLRPAARRPAGCGSRTNSAAPSCTPRSSPSAPGRRWAKPQCKPNCAEHFRAGAARGGCGWTMAILGGPKAICRPRWPCGSWG